MKVTCLEVGLAAGMAALFSVCWIPSALFFGWERGDNAIDSNIPGMVHRSASISIYLSIYLRATPAVNTRWRSICPWRLPMLPHKFASF